MASLETWKQVKGLPAKTLNDLCEQKRIKTKNYSKLAKVHLLCTSLGISTVGLDEEEDLNHLNTRDISPHWDALKRDLTSDELNKLKFMNILHLHRIDDWSTDLTLMPPIKDDHVTQFLLKRKTIELKNDTAYKTSKPHKMMKFVHSLSIHDYKDTPFVCIQSQNNSSMKTKQEDVKLCYVILDRNRGYPYIGVCVCTAGYVL